MGRNRVSNSFCHSQGATTKRGNFEPLGCAQHPKVGLQTDPHVLQLARNCPCPRSCSVCSQARRPAYPSSPCSTAVGKTFLSLIFFISFSTKEDLCPCLTGSRQIKNLVYK